MSAVTVTAAVGAKRRGSAGAVTVGGGDGVGRRSVGGTICQQSWAK